MKDGTMRKRESHPIRKHTLNLYEGDFERLTVLFPKAGAGKIIRTLVRKFVTQVEEQAQQNATPSPIEIEDV